MQHSITKRTRPPSVHCPPSTLISIEAIYPLGKPHDDRNPDWVPLLHLEWSTEGTGLVKTLTGVEVEQTRTIAKDYWKHSEKYTILNQWTTC